MSEQRFVIEKDVAYTCCQDYSMCPSVTFVKGQQYTVAEYKDNWVTVKEFPAACLSRLFFWEHFTDRPYLIKSDTKENGEVRMDREWAQVLEKVEKVEAMFKQMGFEEAVANRRVRDCKRYPGGYRCKIRYQIPFGKQDLIFRINCDNTSLMTMHCNTILGTARAGIGCALYNATLRVIDGNFNAAMRDAIGADHTFNLTGKMDESMKLLGTWLTNIKNWLTFFDTVQNRMGAEIETYKKQHAEVQRLLEEDATKRSALLQKLNKFMEILETKE